MQKITVLIIAGLMSTEACAQEVDLSAFSTGPVFHDLGPVADVPEVDLVISDNAEFYIAFDVAEPANADQINRGFVSAARLMNMHQRAGIEPGRNHIAVVVHGAAVLDLLNDQQWAKRGRGEVNPSAHAVREMIGMGVRFIVCGQSAAAQKTARKDLVPGVEMALSAMTAHALLQQQGYTLNPF